MLTIHKYPFPIADSFVLDLPQGAAVLSAQLQHGKPCLWALVDTDRPREPAEFRIFGTGHHVDAELGRFGYVSTLQKDSFVWHVFRIATSTEK